MGARLRRLAKLQALQAAARAAGPSGAAGGAAAAAAAAERTAEGLADAIGRSEGPLAEAALQAGVREYLEARNLTHAREARLHCWRAGLRG